MRRVWLPLPDGGEVQTHDWAELVPHEPPVGATVMLMSREPAAAGMSRRVAERVTSLGVGLCPNVKRAEPAETYAVRPLLEEFAVQENTIPAGPVPLEGEAENQAGTFRRDQGTPAATTRRTFRLEAVCEAAA